MSIRVFTWDQNPDVDHFAFRQSDARGAEIIASGRGFQIEVDGRAAIYLYPPQEIAADRERKTGSMTDWVTRRVSYLPDGATLRITTKQLNA